MNIDDSRVILALEKPKGVLRMKLGDEWSEVTFSSFDVMRAVEPLEGELDCCKTQADLIASAETIKDHNSRLFVYNHVKST